ncbi:MAG: ATP-binding protein [Chloroflexota bacterium]
MIEPPSGIPDFAGTSIDPRVIVDALGDGVALVAADGAVAWANARLAELAGRPAADLAGRPLAGLLPDVELTAGDRRAWLQAEGAAPVPVAAALRPAGEGGWALLVKDLRPWIGEAGVRGSARRTDVDRALGAVFRAAMHASGDELEIEDRARVVAEVLAEQGAGLVHDTDCVVALLDPGRPGTIEIAGAAGPWAGSILGRHLPLAGSFVERSLLAGRIVETSRAQEASRHGPLLGEGDIHTMRLVPVVAAQRLPDGRAALGTIGFYSRRSRPFTEHQRTLIDDFASLVSLSLQRAVLLRAVRVTARRLELGIELAVDISGSLDEREVVRRLLDRLLDAVVAERAVLLRIEGADTVVEDSRDLLGVPDLIGYRHPVAQQPLMVEALAAKQPVIGGAYTRGVMPEALQRALAGVLHTLTVPLVLSGEVMAVIVLSRRRDDAFGEDEVATVQLIGNLAALALRNAWLYAEAQEASRLKSDFLNMAAHELRTPLTVITGYLSMLREGSFGPPPPEWRHPVEMLDTKAGELGRLVEDLLLAARLDSGRLPVHQQRLDLGAVAEAAMDRAGARAQMLGAHLELEVSETPPVEADADHVGRILDNLINNALTYSRGTAWVRIQVGPGPRGPVVEVEDRGRGIAPAFADRVFERFSRIDDDAYPQQAGTGLGLYISRELAARQRAELWLDWSRVGEGSRFVLSFPEPAE